MINHLKASLLATVAALALTSCSTAPEPQAQQHHERTVAKERAGPTLIALVQGVNDPSKERALHIASLDVAVDVRGDLAETIVTATFDNPGAEELEGRFVLNIARGAVVTGYALDINGTLVDGVLETRYKAAEAYQSRVNRRIDPGVAEVDYSDRFETRIYPVPARGSRTIRLSMISQFDPDSGYTLPLTVQDAVDRFSMNVKGDAEIAAVPQGLTSGASIEARNIALKGALRLAAPAQRAPVIVSRHPGAETFFDIVGSAPRGGIDRRKPLHIFWDRSVSRTDDALREEAQLAEDLAMKRGLRRATLTLFDSGRTETKDVGADRISETLGDVRYRGGTSYASLSTVPVASGADCLMFSDGRVTIDDRASFSLPCAITAITSGPERDAAWLGDLAQRTGGAFHILTKSSVRDVFHLLDRPDASILSVTDGDGKPIDAVPLASDGRSFHLVGPAPADGVVLVRMEGEATARRFEIPAVRLVTFAGPGALWARHHLGVIAADAKPDDLAATARRYGIATPDASFVVLETPNDYVQADIAPPDSYPKQLRAAYAELRDRADKDLRNHQEARLTKVVGLWEKQKAWWASEFNGPSPVATPSTQRPAGLESPMPSSGSSGAGDGLLGGTERGTAREDRDVMVVTANRREETVQDVAVAVTAITSELRDQIGLTTVQDYTNFAPGLSYSTANERDDADESADKPATSRAGSIAAAEWNADRPYIAKFDKAGDNWEQAIDDEVRVNGALPLFWFDVAEWHWHAGRKEEARRAVEAALDVPSRDNQTLAIVAARLLRYGSHDRAIWLLKRLMEREEKRPQPKRTLALALLERAKVDATPEDAKADMGRAIELLAKVATDVYDQESLGIETVALMEANAALAKLKAMGGSSDALDPRLVALLDTDLRVVMEWNTPRTDLDLWVKEPKGFDVGYSSPRSPWGGKLSGDITDGYGPEEYLVRRAISGAYAIRANTFASDRANPNGPSTLTVRLIRNFGRPDQSEELLDIEMEARDRDKTEIGKITIE